MDRNNVSIIKFTNSAVKLDGLGNQLKYFYCNFCNKDTRFQTHVSNEMLNHLIDNHIDIVEAYNHLPKKEVDKKHLFHHKGTQSPKEKDVKVNINLESNTLEKIAQYVIRLENRVEKLENILYSKENNALSKIMSS